VTIVGSGTRHSTPAPTSSTAAPTVRAPPHSRFVNVASSETVSCASTAAICTGDMTMVRSFSS
jgi:hypothetical protein